MSQGDKMHYAQMIWDYMKREDPLEKVSNNRSLQSRIQDFTLGGGANPREGVGGG